VGRFNLVGVADYNNGKIVIMVIFTLPQATKPQKGSRDIALLFL